MKVTFDNAYSAFQVIAPKGTMISYTATPTALADGVYVIGDEGAICIDDQLTDTLYLSTVGSDYTVTDGSRVIYPLGDTSVIIRANISTVPFKSGAKGGGSSGDNTHYKGTTTTPISNGSTTNPITIDGEEYTAVFGDIVVYGYTEFVFDGSAWSEFGRPFDTTPTSGSANAVTSDGIYNALLFQKGTGQFAVKRMSTSNNATSTRSMALGYGTTANSNDMTVFGKFNSPKANDLFEIGNGTSTSSSDRSNILEVNSTELNVNGAIKKNNVPLPTPYTTMPTITASMLGQIAQYVGETTNDYVKGYFYIASSDGETEPTYSWVPLKVQDESVGIENTVLYIYDSTIGTRDNIQIPESAYDFDEIYVEFSISPSSTVTSTIIRQVSPNTNINISTNATADTNNWLSYTIYPSSPTTITAYQNPQDKTLRLYKVIGRRYARIQPECSYTTTERKIGKWIDGSDLYQRTFEVTGLSKNTWNNSILDTSDIKIVDFTGLIYWLDNQAASDSTSLNYYASGSDNCFTCINTAQTDMRIYPTNTSSDMSIDKAVITIKYTKLPA